MADEKISDLPAASSVADADLATVVQSGTNKKSALSVIKTYIQAAFDAIYVPLSRTLTIGGSAQTLAANRSWTTNTILEGLGTPAQGDILYRGSSNWVLLTPGTDGNVLTTHSVSSNPTWSPVPASAPTTAHFVTTESESSLSNEFNLGSLTTGLLKHTVSGSVSTPATASAGTDYTDLAFKTISVSGQSDVVADSASDTLTLAAGSNITITTNPGTDTITITATSSGAPDTAHYVTTQAEGGLSNEFNLGSLSSGILYQTVASSISTPAVVTVGAGLLFTGGTLSATGTGGFGYWDSVIQVTGSDFTTTNSTLTDITGLTFAVAINKVYEVEVLLVGLGSDSNGAGFAVACSASGSAGRSFIRGETTSGALTQQILSAGSGSTNFWQFSDHDSVIEFHGQITTVGNTGNITVQGKKNTAGTLTIRKGSVLKIRALT